MNTLQLKQEKILLFQSVASSKILKKEKGEKLKQTSVMFSWQLVAFVLNLRHIVNNLSIFHVN